MGHADAGYMWDRLPSPYELTMIKLESGSLKASGLIDFKMKQDLLFDLDFYGDK